MKSLVLSPHCALKMLEEPCVYNMRADELYTLDNEAFDFLVSLRKPRKPEGVEEGFIDYCINEGILVDSGERNPWPVHGGSIPAPTLRYLEVLLTDRCNLRCTHCYLGLKGGELDTEELFKVLKEFEEMGGLKILLSGGEPMLHSRFREINSMLKRFSFRSVLLTNGLLIDERAAMDLNFHEVQVSIDGLRESHDFLRGEGTFEKAVEAVKTLRRKGVEVSVATMVHRKNRHDFPAMEGFLRELGVRGWSIDVPCVADDGGGVFLSYQEAAGFLSYGFGSPGHCSSPGYACGSHLICLTSSGTFARCGFFRNEPVGSPGEGLRAAWHRLHHWTLSELDCDCPHIEECRGGCRYRAYLDSGSLSAPDPVLCKSYGVECPDPKGSGQVSLRAPA